MTVPTYEEFMLPVLHVLAGGEPLTTRLTSLVDHGVGVQVASTHTLKRLDQDYFDAL